MSQRPRRSSPELSRGIWWLQTTSPTLASVCPPTPPTHPRSPCGGQSSPLTGGGTEDKTEQPDPPAGRCAAETANAPGNSLQNHPLSSIPQGFGLCFKQGPPGGGLGESAGTTPCPGPGAPPPPSPQPLSLDGGGWPPSRPCLRAPHGCPVGLRWDRSAAETEKTAEIHDVWAQLRGPCPASARSPGLGRGTQAGWGAGAPEEVTWAGGEGG